MHTIYNGQLFQYARLSNESLIIKLAGVEEPVVIKSSDKMFQHYKMEHEKVSEQMVQARQKEALNLINTPPLG